MKISPERLWEICRPILERGGAVLLGRYAGWNVDDRCRRDCTTGRCHASPVIHHLIHGGIGRRHDPVLVTERIDPATEIKASPVPWSKGRYYVFEIAWLSQDGGQKRAGFACKALHPLDDAITGGCAAEPRPAL